LAYDGKLLAAVTRIAIDSILGFYKRRMRDVDGVVGQGGAVSVVQRTSSDLRLNPHLRNRGCTHFNPLHTKTPAPKIHAIVPKQQGNCTIVQVSDTWFAKTGDHLTPLLPANNPRDSENFRHYVARYNSDNGTDCK